MKKLLTLALAAVLALSLVACGGSGSINDGTYTEWIPQLEENVKAAGTADKIEAVAGATSSSESVKVLMAAVEKQAKAGNTEVVLVDNAE